MGLLDFKILKGVKAAWLVVVPKNGPVGNGDLNNKWKLLQIGSTVLRGLGLRFISHAEGLLVV
jgi:hypothetical protein